MNRTTAVLVAVAAAVTIAVTAVLTTSHASSLPVPHIPLVAAASNGSAAKAKGSGAHGGGSSGSGGGSSAFIPGSAPTLTGCSVTVSNPRPLQGQTAETVTVTTTGDVLVSVVATYAHTRSRHAEVTPATGSISFSLPVQHAPVGVTVGVTATASLRSQKVTCATSFTPVP